MFYIMTYCIGEHLIYSTIRIISYVSIVSYYTVLQCIEYTITQLYVLCFTTLYFIYYTVYDKVELFDSINKPQTLSSIGPVDYITRRKVKPVDSAMLMIVSLVSTTPD